MHHGPLIDPGAQQNAEIMNAIWDQPAQHETAEKWAAEMQQQQLNAPVEDWVEGFQEEQLSLGTGHEWAEEFQEMKKDSMHQQFKGVSGELIERLE